MEDLRNTYCRHEMVCDNPKGNEVEVVHMPSFFETKPEIETVRTHLHLFYEIVWFRKGSGIHTVDFTEYPVEENTLFFISPGQLHSFDSSRNSEGIVMKICSHLLGDIVANDTSLLKYNVFDTYDSVPYRRITPECEVSLDGIVKMLEAEAGRSDSIGHREYLQSLVTMMLIQVERGQVESERTVFSPGKTAHRTFLAFRRAVEQNYRSIHTVAEYANLLNVTTKSLSNYVRECSGFSPLEMINNRIILEAKRMLRYSDMMIKEIAAQLGFGDPSYFIKFFKRIAKCSPADYRTPE